MRAVSFQQVCKTYPGARGALRALDGVSFDIEPGEFFGLLGPNGAGKTTLISILAGLTRASSGRVEVQGHDVVADYATARKALGIVPQELVFDPFFSVREALRIQSGYFGVRRNDDWIDELLASLGLADKADANMRRRWCTGRPSSCSTSRQPVSMSSCARRCGSSSPGSTARATPCC
jgi:ABC-2 type transport system ATP-binding protein